MVSGIKFYSGDTGEVIRKSVQVDHVSLTEIVDDLPVDIYSIVEKAIEREPEDRYQNSGEMAQDIKDCLKRLGSELDNLALQEFILAIFTKEYESEKENAKKILAGKPQTFKQVQFDKIIFLDTEFTVSEEQTEILSYAPKNTASDPLQTQQQPMPETEFTPEEAPPAQSAQPPQPEEKPEIRSKAVISPALEKEERPKPLKQSRSIPISKPQKSKRGKKLQDISIKASDRRVRSRVKTGLDVTSIIRSFGPWFIAALLIIAGVYYGYQGFTNNHPKDYFAGISAPEVPPPSDDAIMTSSQKQVLLLGLNMKAEAAVADGSLIEPIENNAYVLVNQAMQLAPDDSTVQAHYTKLISLLAHHADVAIQEGRKEDAARLLVAGLALVPDYPKLSRLKSELAP